MHLHSSRSASWLKSRSSCCFKFLTRIASVISYETSNSTYLAENKIDYTIFLYLNSGWAINWTICHLEIKNLTFFRIRLLFQISQLHQIIREMSRSLKQVLQVPYFSRRLTQVRLPSKAGWIPNQSIWLRWLQHETSNLSIFNHTLKVFAWKSSTYQVIYINELRVQTENTTGANYIFQSSMCNISKSTQWDIKKTASGLRLLVFPFLE